jgi:signal transduction histidine kinase
VVEEVNLHNLIEACISELGTMVGIETIAFEINIDSAIRVASDYSRLKIILDNLLSNSVKYKDQRKDRNSVKITFESGKTVWQIVIEDNGIGIDKQYLSRVFEMFYRATDRSRGSGLGLYIVKETVERLYGEVHVDSDIGKWTRVSVTFPHEPVYIRKK